MIGISAFIVAIVLLVICIKREEKHRKIFLSILILIVLLYIIYGIIIFINHKAVRIYTIKDIIGEKFETINYVSTDYAKDKNIIDDLKKEFNNKQLKKEKYIDELINEKLTKSILSGIRKYTYICSDENNDVVCTIIVERNWKV